VDAPIPPRNLPPGRVVEVDGRGEMFVRERPAAEPGAPTILLLHGWTASADLNWFRVYDTIGPHARIIAVDHRGHGRGLRTTERFSLEDAADDAAALLRQLGAAPATVVGYSMGGPISMLLWHRHPEVVNGLVLEATALEWRATARERFVWRFMGAVEFVLRSGRPRGLLDRGLRRAVKASPDIEPLVPWLKGELRRGDPEALADAGRALGRYDARPFAGTIDVPTAVVVTTKDRLVRPVKQRQLAAAIPGATTFAIAADHDACLVRADEFRRVTAAALEDVLARIGGAQADLTLGLTESSTRVAGWGA
jgi:pimeloyl-ACP methyl ester carboxylesterase